MGKPVVAHVTEAKNLSYMTLGEKLKALRRDLGLSQEALGAQGFVSTPGWIKIENGQLIDKLVRWLIDDKYMRAGAANTLKEELLTLKYLGSRSTFVRELAKTHARKLPTGAVLLAAEEPGAYKVKPKRGRPPSQTKAIKG
jgi:transcriptional regulator with XRE-family HTH domain